MSARPLDLTQGKPVQPGYRRAVAALDSRGFVQADPAVAQHFAQWNYRP